MRKENLTMQTQQVNNKYLEIFIELPLKKRNLTRTNSKIYYMQFHARRGVLLNCGSPLQLGAGETQENTVVAENKSLIFALELDVVEVRRDVVRAAVALP